MVLCVHYSMPSCCFHLWDPACCLQHSYTSLKKFFRKVRVDSTAQLVAASTETADKHEDELQVPGEFLALSNHSAQMESRARSNRVSAMKAKQRGLSFRIRAKLGTKKVPAESPTNKGTGMWRLKRLLSCCLRLLWANLFIFNPKHLNL